MSEQPPGHEFIEEEMRQLHDWVSWLLTMYGIAEPLEVKLFDSKQNLTNEENDPQSDKLGLTAVFAPMQAKLLNSVTKIPFTNFWHRLTLGFASVIFIANVIIAIYDVAREQRNLHYKVSNIFCSIVASVLLFLLELRLHAKRKEWEKKEDYNMKKKKKQQYIENILHEVLLYPIIVLNVFGFANDRVETDPFGTVQLVLIIIDAIDVLWTQMMRIYIIHTFLKDIRAFLGSKVDIGLYIFHRGIFTAISNFVLFIFLIILLGLQVHNDNYCNTHDSKTDIWCKNMTNNNSTDPLKYRGSVNSTFLLIAVVLMPLFNLVMFVVVNYFWVLELLLLLGAESKEDKWKDADIGRTVADIADIAKASVAKLNNIRSVPPFTKFISVVTKPVFAAMILVWEVILVLAIYYFDGCHQSFSSWCSKDVVQSIFVVIAIVTNTHAVIVAILFNAGIVIAIAAVLFYPVSFPLFLKRDDIVPVEESHMYSFC